MKTFFILFVILFSLESPAKDFEVNKARDILRKSKACSIALSKKGSTPGTVQDKIVCINTLRASNHYKKVDHCALFSYSLSDGSSLVLNGKPYISRVKGNCGKSFWNLIQAPAIRDGDTDYAFTVGWFVSQPEYSYLYGKFPEQKVAFQSVRSGKYHKSKIKVCKEESKKDDFGKSYTVKICNFR